MAAYEMAAYEKDQLVETDWSAITLGERIRHLEVEGYVVLPDLLSREHIGRLKAATRKLETTAVDYSVHQLGCPNVQFVGGAITELIAHPPTIEFLKQLFGDRVIMMDCGYSRSEPGHPGISLHCDGQPWGSKIFGFEHSCPKLVRVLYYLDDLTPDVSFAPELSRRCEPVSALHGTPRSSDGDLQGRLGGLDPSECGSRQLPQCRRGRPRDDGHCIPAGLGGSGWRGAGLGC
jgi:hypothetical protein